MQERLVVNSLRFPHETIDNETILFDAETGHILLLAGFASVLWSHLAGGAQPAELCEAVDSRFGSDAGAATRTFLNDLRAAEILVPSSEEARTDAKPSSWPSQFTAPLLERYDDIAKIIAMDPIHEVAVTGWPRSAHDSEA
jgi:Coenzyme PQQ synthesis protein D (PqqD)